jgi:hypothetical protein
VDSPYYSESELCGGTVAVSFSKAPPLASDTLRTTFYPLLENVLQTVDHFEISCLGAPFLFIVGKAQKSRGVRSGLYGGCSNGLPPSHFSQAEHRIQFKSLRMRFLVFFNHEKGDPLHEISKWSTVCSTFSRSGWSVARSASLAKGGTSKKKRPSPHFHKVQTLSNKVTPRSWQTFLVHIVSVNYELPRSYVRVYTLIFSRCLASQ